MIASQTGFAEIHGRPAGRSRRRTAAGLRSWHSPCCISTAKQSTISHTGGGESSGSFAQDTPYRCTCAREAAEPAPPRESMR